MENHGTATGRGAACILPGKPQPVAAFSGSGSHWGQVFPRRKAAARALQRIGATHGPRARVSQLKPLTS